MKANLRATTTFEVAKIKRGVVTLVAEDGTKAMLRAGDSYEVSIQFEYTGRGEIAVGESVPRRLP